MKLTVMYIKMLRYLLPYLHLFIIATLLSVLVVAMDGSAIWFLTNFTHILFNPETKEILKPELSITTVYDYLNYLTFFYIQNNKFMNPLLLFCILIALTYTFKNIFFYTTKVIMHYVNISISRDMRILFFKHVLLLPLSFYDRNKSGKIISLLVNDLNQINRSITGTIGNLAKEPLQLLTFITMLVIINWKLTFFVFIVYPLMGFVIVKIGNSVRRKSSRELASYSDFVSILTETINSIRAVKMFNTNAFENTKFKKENNNYRQKAFKAARTREIVSPLTENFGIYGTVLLLWYGGRDVLSGTSDFTGLDFIRFLTFLFLSYQPIKALGNINVTIQAGLAAANRVFSLLNLKVEKIGMPKNKKIPELKKKVVFNNVHFTYPETTEKILDGISFEVKKGEIIAIVGSSGSGKSTILDLLPRFYDIQEGSIIIDKKDIREYNLGVLRELFGIVSQETILFDDTIRANIAYGTPDASEKEIIRAAETANTMEFIEKLPEKMDTIIGERGVTLSGGQCQRLSIARAILKNPQILILDEATSALDTESEKLVQNAINNLVQNRTTFIVAHRLSTIQHANKIIILEDGRIIEEGTHSELIELGKRYKHFYDIQFTNTNNNSA